LGLIEGPGSFDHVVGSLLIICNQEPAGSVDLKKQDRDTFELTKMVIVEKFRGQGIGESLCREAIQRAKSMGARRLILYSNSSLRAALQLYRKLGFREIPLEKGLYSHFRCDTKMEFLFDLFAIIHAGKDLAWTLSQIGRKSFHDAFLPYFHNREELTVPGLYL
jgi:ribosomal protein S18 acetylase RimI-like enzyme